MRWVWIWIGACACLDAQLELPPAVEIVGVSP